MAVLKTCCCCGVRSGSIGSAIYSLVLAIVGLVFYGWQASVVSVAKAEWKKIGFELGGIVDALHAIYIIACIVFVVLIIACILVFIAISQDSKGLLVPFMIAQGLHFLYYFLILVVTAAYMVQVGMGDSYIYLATMIVLIPFFIGDLFCLLCVISQYQEYNDGRGRAIDQPAATPTNTTVVIHQNAPAPQDPPAYK